MPPKHPLLFSALAVVLAVMLFNASIVQVSGAPWLLIGLIISNIITGGLAAYFGWNYLQAKGEEPGVTLDSYMRAVADGWKTSLLNLVNTARNYASLIHQGKMLYVRYAEYEAKNFVDLQNLDAVEDQVMLSVAYDLYQLKKSVDEGIEYFINDLIRFAKERLTGDLQNYDITTTRCEAPAGTGLSFKRAENGYYAHRISHGASIIAWVWGPVSVAVADADEDWLPDGHGTFTFKAISVLGQSGTTTSINVNAESWNTANLQAGIWEIKYTTNYVGSGIIRARDILIISGSTDVGLAIRVINADNSKVIKFTNHLCVKGAGTVSISDLNSAYMNLINNVDAVYDTAYSYAKVMHHTLRSLGYTDPSKIPPNLVLPPPDVILPTVSDLYQNFSQNWEDIIAAYYGYLRSLAEAFNQTHYRMVRLFNAMNATFADVREKFLNVIIKDVNGTIWAQVEKLIPLWVSEAQEFYANQTNVLRGVMGALIQFANGTVKYVEIPRGWQIIPGSITTPNGQVPTLVLQNWSGGLNPAYIPGNYTQPQVTTPAIETIQVAMQLFMIILPLVLIVAVVRMIMDFGRGR